MLLVCQQADYYANDRIKHNANYSGTDTERTAKRLPNNADNKTGNHT